jgi:hypothetical protein
MKNRLILVISVLWIIVFILISCATKAQISSEESSEFIGEKITKAFGSFLIPEDWIEIEMYSKNNKYFYSHKSEQIGSTMTNISIEIGSNPYELDNHPSFRGAILGVLLMQARAMNAEVSPSYIGKTKSDYPIYGFTIEEKNENIMTIQFYICGNKKHIMVYATDFHNGNITNVIEVAQFIAKNFVWSN